MQKTYTLKELELRLRVDERTLFRYLASGKLDGTKPGGKWLFTDEDVQKFLKAGRKKLRK